MRILSIQNEPSWTIAYQLAGAAGRTITAQLPILFGVVDTLPVGLQAVVCLSDLQGVEPLWSANETPRLLGHRVVEELGLLAGVGVTPPAEATGIILAGDLYAASTADQRGVEGDVLPVWRAFQTAFRWVAGVAGNHDRFEKEPGQDSGMYYLDGTTCSVDSLRIAGIGGIIGNPTKRLRRTEVDYTATIRKLAQSRPDILVVHESPAIVENGFLGSTAIRTALERLSFPLIICGHTRWSHPLVELLNGSQILNVDSRVIVLTRAPG
jgi:Icc protein